MQIRSFLCVKSDSDRRAIGGFGHQEAHLDMIKISYWSLGKIMCISNVAASQ